MARFRNFYDLKKSQDLVQKGTVRFKQVQKKYFGVRCTLTNKKINSCSYNRLSFLEGVLYDDPKMMAAKEIKKVLISFLFLLQKTPGPGTYCKTYQTPMPDTIKKMARNYGLFFTSGTYGEYY